MKLLQHRSRFAGFAARVVLLGLLALLLLTGALALLFKKPQSEALACDYTIGPTVIKADGLDNYADVSPGDTVCVTGGARPVLKLRNFKGAPGQPIVFINTGGAVIIQGTSQDYAGIDFWNSEHVRLTGAGLREQCGAGYSVREQACGFVVTSSQRGVAGINQTRHVEIDHVEIHHVAKSGITVKSKHQNGASRDAWKQVGTYLHHNYLHDIGTEGFYVGGSFYERGHDPLLEEVDISHNLIVRTGWDGLQVGSAVKECAIHHNRIVAASLAREASQRSGIMNNRGSVCHIFNNYIVDSVSRGIYVQGNGGNQIYNNMIIRPGRQDTDKGDGIVVTSGSNEDQPVFIWNNTIIEPQRSGIRFRNERGADNLIENNLIVAPAMLAQAGDEAFIDTGDLTNVILQNNVFVQSVAEVGFTDPYVDDFSLGPDAKVNNVGADFYDEEVTTWLFRNAPNRKN